MQESEVHEGEIATLKLMIQWFIQKRNSLTKANYGITQSGGEFDPNYNLLPKDFRGRWAGSPRENKFWRESRDERKKHLPRAMCLIGAAMYLSREARSTRRTRGQTRKDFCSGDILAELCTTLDLGAGPLHPYDDCRTGYEVVLEQWNDEEERTKEDVIDVCKRTLERLEARA